MNKKTLVACCITGLLVAGTFVAAQAPKAPAPAVASSDPRIDKLLEQNAKILQQQDEILKQLNLLQEWMAQLRRRSA